MRAEVLRRHAARDRKHFAAGDRGLQRTRDVSRVELLPVEVALHQRLVRLDDRVEELLPVLVGLVGQLRRDRDGLSLLLSLGAQVRAHVQHVDDPRELVLRPDRQVHGDALLRELLPDRREGAEEVGALPVEHVHEQHARKPEVGGTRPLAAGADLGAHHAGEDEERTFDDPQRRDRVSLEAGIAGRVDQVDLALLPLEVRERRGERHLPFLLVVVPVGDGRPRLDRPEPVHHPRLEEQGLHERRLANAAVSDDCDVTDLPGLVGHAARPPRSKRVLAADPIAASVAEGCPYGRAGEARLQAEDRLRVQL